MTLLIACARCGHGLPRDATVCPQCGQQRRSSSLKRGHARGYDHAHRRRRTALLPQAVGTLCSICGELMTEGQALDLHHSLPLVIAPNSVGDVIVHASCNRGGRKAGPVFRDDA